MAAALVSSSASRRERRNHRRGSKPSLCCFQKPHGYSPCLWFGFVRRLPELKFCSGYLCFQQNTIKEKMEMTTPVVTRKVQSVGEKMEMTTPVITRKGKDQTQWRISFVMPSKYGSNLPLPKDSSIKI